jgi:hypothetical protein
VWSLFYSLSGGGTTTVRAIAMDGTDSIDFPGSVVLGTALADGNNVLPIGVATTLVVSSFRLQFVASAGSKLVTATLFGRAL